MSLSFISINKAIILLPYFFENFIYKRNPHIILISLRMAETLYFTSVNDPNHLQAVIAAQFAGIKLPEEQINKKYDPVNLLTPQGLLTQPNTILLYLLRDKMVGQTEQQKIRVHQWFQHFHMELYPLLKEIYQQISKEKPENQQKYGYALKQLLRVLQLFNNHLKIRTFFVGDSLTAVDIHLATHLNQAFKIVINEGQRKKLTNLTRWFTFVRSTGPFLNTLGNITLCGAEEFSFPIDRPIQKQAAEVIKTASQ